MVPAQPDPADLAPERVAPLLRGAFGRPYRFEPVVASTQELARVLPAGGVVAADRQTAGRGRHGRPWTSPPGAGLLFSLVLRPPRPPDELAALSLVAAEAVCEATLPDAAVRWPNDVVVGGRKLAGVLLELREGVLVIGVGLNANLAPGDFPADARVPATSLLAETGLAVDRAALLADVLQRLEERYRAWLRDGFPGLARDELRGRVVRLGDGSTGRAEGVDGAGRLLLDGVPLLAAEVVGVSPLSADPDA